jgi:hypothetical protein
MPANKDFKRLIRGRMRKTGESYTAARAHLLAHRPTRTARPRPSAADYATLAGRSDAALKAATGCTWERWVRALDHAGAHTWTHRDIAKHVSEKYEVPGWWAQSVTVGYERIRGLRAIGQRRGGLWETTKSKTIAVPVDRLFDAWANARARKRWLGDVKLKVRTATKPKSMRITWDDDTSVDVGFFAKGAAKSSVAVAHVKLVSKEDADRRKKFWTERLAALAALLTSP